MFKTRLIAVVMVTDAPIGAIPYPFADATSSFTSVGQIVTCTLLISPGSAGVSSLSRMLHNTVPPPFQAGYTWTAPTPSIARIAFLYAAILPPNAATSNVSKKRALKDASVSSSEPETITSPITALLSPATAVTGRIFPKYEFPMIPAVWQLRL